MQSKVDFEEIDMHWNTKPQIPVVNLNEITGVVSQEKSTSANIEVPCMPIGEISSMPAIYRIVNESENQGQELQSMGQGCFVVFQVQYPKGAALAKQR